MPHYQQIDAQEGFYRRADGTRVDLLRVENIRTPHGYNVGWEFFADDAAALAAWGLEYDPLPAQQEEAAAADVDAEEAALNGETNYDAEFWGEDAPAADSKPNPES